MSWIALFLNQPPMKKTKTYKVYLEKWWVVTITGVLITYPNHVMIIDEEWEEHIYKKFRNIKPIKNLQTPSKTLY